jgi:Icc-related predicted phosphoesterase
MMKLLVVSDFHGSIDASHRTAAKAKKTEADIIVVCGDITHFGSVEDAEKILAPLTTLGLPALFVAGNCDPAQLAEAQIKGAVNIHKQCHRLGDVSFMGLGAAPASRFYSWFEMSEANILDALVQTADRCSGGKQLVVASHTPPKGTKVDLAFSKIHAGSASLRTFIEKRKPNIVFCGHIHEAKGIDHIGDTIIVNPGPVRHGNCAIADIGDKVEVNLDSV